MPFCQPGLSASRRGPWAGAVGRPNRRESGCHDVTVSPQRVPASFPAGQRRGRRRAPAPHRQHRDPTPQREVSLPGGSRLAPRAGTRAAAGELFEAGFRCGCRGRRVSRGGVLPVKDRERLALRRSRFPEAGGTGGSRCRRRWAAGSWPLRLRTRSSRCCAA